MLMVKASKGPSRIHGQGLIAREFVPRWSVVWKLVPSFDRLITEESLARLSEVARQQVLFYAYYDSELKCYVLSSDDDRFTNHSDGANTVNGREGLTVALRDIEEGEEITWCYRGFGEVPQEMMQDNEGSDSARGWDVFM